MVEERKPLQITLEAARVYARLTQKDVAEKMGKSNKTIGNWENGKTEIDPANFTFLCNLYGVDKECIFLPYELTKS